MKLSPIIGNRIQQLRQKFSQSVGLPIQEALPMAQIEAALVAENVVYRRCLFDPFITIWAFLSQVLDADRSCRKALSRVWAYLAASTPASGSAAETLEPDTDTSIYCKARQRLSEAVLKRLYRTVGDHLEADVEETRLWYGRRVHLVDGSTVSMPDTPANQAAFPQHPNQAPGCGFPLAKIVVVFSLLTGAVRDVALDVWSAAETTLFRRLHALIQAHDVVVGDRIYGTYADICLLCQRQVDSLFRHHGSRPVDLRKGQRLGKEDRLQVWEKPAQCPPGLSAQHFKHLPPTLHVRVLRFTLPRKGLRPKRITVVTTLLDPRAYPKEELARLYGLRWEAEIDLRHLKSSMDMDVLRTQSPDMIRKELAMYFLAYNLIRSLMAQAGQRWGGDPLRLSFKGTVQHLNTFLPLLAHAGTTQRRHLYDTLLRIVAREQLPDRPGRVEPRAVKRRPKWSEWLKQPRAVLKEKLRA